MTTAHATEPAAGTWTAADLVERFGPIPLNRVRHDPAPGDAAARDVVEIHDREDRGMVLGADGMIQLAPGLVRIPDVSFISHARLPGGKVPREAIVPLAPDLAVEVISKDNTRREMQRKLVDYGSFE